MSYYYLISSLPGISLDAKPSISMADFRASCAAQLSPGDQQALEVILEPAAISGTHSHPFVALWHARETQLRNASARLRAAKRQADAGEYIRTHTGFDVGLEARVDEAFAQATPLAREQALDRARWQILDELVGPDPFSAAAVLAYGVKLLISERWASLDAKTGQARIGAALAGNEDKAVDTATATI